MNQLQAQIIDEHEATKKDSESSCSPAIESWTSDQVFQYLATLYIKYIDIYRKLEECYDQHVHPQKRIFVKKVLECTMSRICEIKRNLVENSPNKSIYVHLDQVLFDLKCDPTCIEMPVPRYFREDDRLPVDVKFKEPAIVNPRKKKKNLKKESEAKSAKPAPKPLVERAAQIDRLMNSVGYGDEPEHEVEVDPYNLDLDFQQAIRLIQKNDRGRQGRERMLLIQKQIQQHLERARLRDQMAEKSANVDQNQPEYGPSLLIQRRIRGILARKHVNNLRNTEMEFLGMAKNSERNSDELLNDPVKVAELTEIERKRTQSSHKERYNDALIEIKEEIAANEGRDIQEQMLRERREWVKEHMVLNKGKAPKDIKEFYKCQEEPRTSAEGSVDPGKNCPGKDNKSKKLLDKKKSKEGDKVIRIGPGELVEKFKEQQEEYTKNWQDRDESDNYKQQFDTQLARAEVMPNLEKGFREAVDNMLMVELENIKLLAANRRSKKDKPKKKPKKKSKAKRATLKLPGYKYVKDKKPEELLKELIQNNIVKKLPAQNLRDFVGESNYVHSLMDDVGSAPADPSMALIRQLVTEYVIFPLGSELCRERFPEHVRSFMFYGPRGCGKTQVVQACATETNSMLFDLSPSNIEGVYSQKKDLERMLASVMVVAKEYQPSIVYIDECEKIWPARKKKKGKKRRRNAAANGSTATRIKKALGKWKSQFLGANTRVTILGCTSHPEDGSKKEFKAFFDKQIYFPVPDYSTRRLMWRTYLEKCGAKLRPDFPLSSLAQISEGYSAGSIKRTCEKVLTEYRVQQQDLRPLALPEFIGQLSISKDTYCTYSR